LQHRELFFADDAALLEPREELRYLLAGFDVADSPLYEPLKPSGYAGIATRVSIVRHWNYFIE
jgi:hypothetical protein